MVVRIRLARFGKRHAPVYNIVIAQARTARGSRPIEVIGTYDPIPKPPPVGWEGKTTKKQKDIKLDISRTKYWLGVGAQPSDPVRRLLSMFGLIEPKWNIARMRELGFAEAAKPKEAREGSGLGLEEERSKRAGEQRLKDEGPHVKKEV